MNSVYNIEAEMNVIGSLIIGGRKAFTEVCTKLKPEHFYFPIYSDAYRVISETQFVSADIDIPALKDKLIAKGYTAAEVDKSLIQGMELVLTAANIGANADVVIANWKAREAYAVTASFEPVADGIDEAITNTVSKLNELTRDAGQRRTQIMADILMPVYEKFFEERDPRTVFLGYEQLDKILGGIEPSDFCLVAARPGVGKTAFALNLIKNAIKAGKKPLLCTLEMSRSQVIERLVSMLSGISLETIRSRTQIKTDEFAKRRIMQAAEELNDYALYINDSGAMTTLDVLSDIASTDADMIIIDHLGLMRPVGKSENRNQEIGKISRDLRMIALQKEIPIIALSQLNRATETRGKKEPILSDLRDSGSLEQDATQVIFLSPYDQTEDGVYIDVSKNRQGQSGMGVVFKFDGSTQRFYETTVKYQEPQTKSKAYKGMPD